MIISVCGPHAAGKSWVVRQVLSQVSAQPIFGMLGTRMPEAYACEDNKFYVLGPYHSDKTAGVDYVTKKGVEALLEFLDRYQHKGPCVFESALTSKRFGTPGEWLLKQKEVRILRLDITFEQCRQNLLRRRAAINNQVPEKGHFERDYAQFESAMRRYELGGARVEKVSPNQAPERILSWLN